MTFPMTTNEFLIYTLNTRMVSSNLAQLNHKMDAIQSTQSTMLWWIAILTLWVVVLTFIVRARSRVLWPIATMTSKIHEKVCPITPAAPASSSVRGQQKTQ